jgi:hypothetical protein
VAAVVEGEAPAALVPDRVDDGERDRVLEAEEPGDDHERWAHGHAKLTTNR